MKLKFMEIETGAQEGDYSGVQIQQQNSCGG